MNLATKYLGLTLAHPLMPGASPMVDDLDVVRRLEDAGAAAIVMHSLFEEQIRDEQVAIVAHADGFSYAHAEARSYLPAPDTFALGPDGYLEQLRRIKSAVGVPVIGSLNGTSLGGWLEYARLMENAGADALELNVYQLATDPDVSGPTLEDRTIEMIRALRDDLRIPLAVKLSPFHTSLAHFARRLDAAGPAGLVLFNRFYQPAIDVDALEVRRELHLSDSTELPLRLRWLAILASQVDASLAASGGVHTVVDVVQALMAGADAVQVVSALLRHGPERLGALRRELAEWLDVHEYESLAQLRGSMSLAACPDPAAYERANYMLMLQSWRA
jgi:dihydroorotate dehydrogenase (fumarate)